MFGKDNIHPDKYTYTFVLKACSNIGIREGKQVHGCVAKNGIGFDEYICNTLIHMYSRFNEFEIAHHLFDEMPEKSIISYNAILSVYCEKGMLELARKLFDEMPERNIESYNFIISGYVGAGLIEEARGIFDDMAMSNVVSWNAMISGYVSTNCFEEALDLFEIMQSSNIEPDDCTLVNILSACARVGALSQGKWVHAYIKKNKINISGFLGTALVDMYSKCGCIEKALEVFYSTKNKDISTWNSIISGLGCHGLAKEALNIFSKMVAKGLEPNEVTFVGVLSACSRGGLLKEGRENFENMFSIFKIEPKIQHYGCMVDLLGRFGLLQEAEELINRLSTKEAPILWESLLGACRNYGNVEMGERISKKILKMSPKETSGYVQLSNFHASTGRWDEAMEVRREMRRGGVRKVPGCSMIEVDGVVHEFLAGEGVLGRNS